MPYIRAKAQDYYERLGGGVDSDILDDTSASVRIQVGEARVRYRSDITYLRDGTHAESIDADVSLKKTLQEHVSVG